MITTRSLRAISHPLKTLSLPPSRIVPPSDEALLSKCIFTLSSAFAHVPCTNAFANESNQTVHSYVDKTIRDSLRSHNGIIVSSANASAVALWEIPPPLSSATTSSPQQPGTGASTLGSGHGHGGPIKTEWNITIQSFKKKHLGVDRETGSVRAHYHLDFLARNPHTPKIAGAISSVVLPLLARAEQESLGVWLEATSDELVPLYRHFGFRVVEEINVGVGRVDGQGQIKQGGEGVRAWLMVVDNCEVS